MAAGLAVSGFCPRGRRAEDGPIPAIYPLVELETPAYAARTRRNVEAASATLIVARGPLRGGTRLTHREATRLLRPVLVIDPDRPGAADDVVSWLSRLAVGELNVAGPRESQDPGIGEAAARLLAAVFPPATAAERSA